MPEGANVVDAEDGYLIPGLWDMHSHTWGRESTIKIVFPLEIAHGVVGIRNMAGDCHGDTEDCADRASFEEIRAMRRDIAAGQLLGPEIHNASTFLDGPHSIKDESLILTTEQEARQAVREHKRQGFDLLKVYDYLPRRVYFALADEARRQGMSFGGHVPWTVSVEEAARAGQKSMEHGFGLYEATSGLEEDFLHERREALQGNEFTREDRDNLLFNPPDGQFLRMLSLEERRFKFSPSRFEELIEAFRANATWHVPTLTMNGHMIRVAPSLDENLLRFIPSEKRSHWIQVITACEQMEPSEREFRRLVLATLLRMIDRLHDAGVGILAGTDCDVDLIVPGVHLHHELELFVEAGLTPLEALQTATLNAAEYLGGTSEMGTIKQGKVADLVLLDANPLEDIRNTTHINAVVLNGRFLGREELDGLLDEVEEAASNIR